MLEVSAVQSRNGPKQVTRMRRSNFDADLSLQRLLEGSYHALDETHLLNSLKKFGTADALLMLGLQSHQLYSTRGSGEAPTLNNFSAVSPSSGTVITQSSLAYMAAAIIMAGGNDFRSAKLSESSENVDALCQIYQNVLPDPFLTTDDHEERSSLLPFLIRIYFEQITWQFSPLNTLTRMYIMYNEIPKKHDIKNWQAVSSTFASRHGFKISEVFWAGFLLHALLLQRPYFSNPELDKYCVEKFQGRCTIEGLSAFVRMLTGDYAKLRELYRRVNGEISGQYTKTKFNPLLRYPIVVLQTKVNSRTHVVPNMNAFVRAAFNGIHWILVEGCITRKEKGNFSECWGAIFQEYVGILLKQIYGNDNVVPEFSYGPNSKRIRSCDWIVDLRDKVYFVEAKANRLRLNSMATGSLKSLDADDTKKVVEPIVQLCRRTSDVSTHSELSKYRNKEIIPVIVYWEIPFSCRLQSEEPFATALKIAAVLEQLPVLHEFCPLLVNIGELELFESYASRVSLEEVYSKVQADFTADFKSVLHKIDENALFSPFLKSKYHEVLQFIDS